MGQPDETLDTDFDSQLRGLFHQAERALEQRVVAERRAEAQRPRPEPELDVVEMEVGDPAPKSTALSLPQLLRPLVQGLEMVSRATTENTTILKSLNTSTASTSDPQSDLPRLVSDLRAMLDAKNGLNQNMFAALHEELKGYKDGFLLQSVYRPIIRDLISLYDDTAEIQRQVTATIADPDCSANLPFAVRIVERLRTLEMNLDHNLEFIVEVLARLEVTLMDPHIGKHDKRSQRAVSVEVVGAADEEGDVVRTVKRGFMWKERVLRAEEVVIKKFRDGVLAVAHPSAEK